MQFIGLLTDLNISYSLASNTGETAMGMNTSLGVQENRNLMSVVCALIDAAVHAQLPSYPAFECAPKPR